MTAIPKSSLPTQEEHDPQDPAEHFVWALRNMPMAAGSGMLTHPAILRGWSRHLSDCGFIHTDAVAALADEDGNVHVSKLPKQRVKFQQAFRGPRHLWNNAARWVKPNEPDPEPVVIPNVQEMTNQERHALLYQFHQMGLIPTPAAGPPLASEENLNR